MTGSFRKDSADLLAKPIAILNLNNQELETYFLEETNSALRRIVKTDEYFFIAGDVIKTTEGISRRYGVINLDQINAVQNQFSSTFNFEVYPNPCKINLKM